MLPSRVDPPQPESQLLHVVPGVCAFRRSGNVIAHVWLGQMTDAIALRFVQVNEIVIRAHPEGVSFVSWIRDGAPLPTAGARKTVSGVMAKYSRSIACIAVVAEGGGFWASAMRSAVTGMGLLAKGEFIMKSHRTLPELENWFPREHEARTGVRVNDVMLRTLVKQTKRDALE